MKISEEALSFFLHRLLEEAEDAAVTEHGLRSDIEALRVQLAEHETLSKALTEENASLRLRPSKALDKTSQERIDATLNARMAKNDERRNANGLADARPYKSNPSFVEDFPESLQERMVQTWELP